MTSLASFQGTFETADMSLFGEKVKDFDATFFRRGTGSLEVAKGARMEKSVRIIA